MLPLHQYVSGTVLVADDQAANRELLDELLSSEGFNVLTAADGASALIPITARILQIVDVYDALTTERPYKKAFSVDEALQTMKQEVAKGWWDPKIFVEFERLVRDGTADLLAKGAGAAGD